MKKACGVDPISFEICGVHIREGGVNICHVLNIAHVAQLIHELCTCSYICVQIVMAWLTHVLMKRIFVAGRYSYNAHLHMWVFSVHLTYVCS